jgi:hypothetical protein
MYHSIEFQRVPHQVGDEWRSGKVFIVPDHVVKVEPGEGRKEDGAVFSTRIITTTGVPELVEGPPSEVNGRLRRGA